MPISMVRTVILYIVIVAAMRLMGKRQLSEMQTSELVVTLLIPDIASIPMQNSSVPLASGLIPIAALIMLEIFLSSAMFKSMRFHSLVCGKPVIIIQNGKIDQNKMKSLRMTSADLFEQLRQLDIFSLDDVSFGIVETNGKLSVLKKPDKLEADASMIGAKIPDTGADMIVVNSGKISEFSLKICGLSSEWVLEKLVKENTSLEKVYLMTANKSKEYKIINFEGKAHA